MAPYGSAADLPSYRELADQLRGFKLLKRFVAHRQRGQVLELERQLKRLTNVVDDFYARLGPRNWIFHDMLNVDGIEALLAETSDAESAEERLIAIYRDLETMRRWTARLRSESGIRERFHQIEKAIGHYNAEQYDSCVLHLIAVMDGFVNDFEPGKRRGLHAREPDEMVAWDSVVGHHLGLTHALSAFRKRITKRIDEEVFELYRNGIMHGSIVHFDNVVVATKAWNMLFAVVDWATATNKAAVPKEPDPPMRETWSKLKRSAAYKRYQKAFAVKRIEAADPSFQTDEVVALAAEFLNAWQRKQWGIVARFMPPQIRNHKSDGDAARRTKAMFERCALEGWSIESLTYDQASTAEVAATAIADGIPTPMRFRMVFRTEDDQIGMPGQESGRWSLATWAPRTYFQGTG